MFSPVTGLILIVCYGAAIFSLSALSRRRGDRGKTWFLLARRQLGTGEAALSVAATWIWAPALFLASEKAYTQGFAGVFWFTVPNVLCLVIFAFFAARLRRLMPAGFTISDFMRTRYSQRVQMLYLVQLSGLAACSFAVQLLAGGKVLVFLTGLPFLPVTILLSAVALSYSLISGLKASVVTDYAQMAVILLVSAVVVPWAVIKAGGVAVIADGMGGRTGTFGNIFAGDGLRTAWSFGIPVTIGLIAGPFGDQSFWQRAFAVREGSVKRAFIAGACIFALVPTALSLPGFIAAGRGWAVTDTSLVNLETIGRLLPPWTMIPVTIMLLSGLVSTLDSNLCAISSLAGHDLFNRRKRRDGAELNGKAVRLSRGSMLLLAGAAVVIANIPGMKILYLFLFYGTLRASTLLPTIITLLGWKASEKGVFLGILAAVTVGLPLFAYGNFLHVTSAAVAGSILTAAIPGLAALLWGKARSGSSP